MKLLFDHNLSHKLVSRLAGEYPGSTQTRLLGFARTADPEIWFYARTHGFIIVSKDEDFRTGCIACLAAERSMTTKGSRNYAPRPASASATFSRKIPIIASATSLVR